MAARNTASVSLCMIVRNEQHQLGDCLAPVAELFDEIVIVDTGSHDETRQVAGRFTPHVFSFPWRDDFSAARNESLRHAHGDWVMWLDADDRLAPPHVARLRSLLARLDLSPRAFLMETLCPGHFACEGATVLTHPRLFRRQPDIRWRGRVHEQLRSGSSRSLDLTSVWTDIQLNHVGYQDLAVRQRKRQRDLRLLRMDYALDPCDISTLVHLGLACFHAGQLSEAREVFQRALSSAKVPGEYLRQVYAALATIARREGNPGEALAILEQGLAVLPDAEYLLYLQADCLYDLDRFVEARQELLELMARPEQPQYHGGFPAQIKSQLAPRRLADALLMEGQYWAAEDILQQLTARFPDDTLSWHVMGRLYLQAQQAEKLFAVAHRLQSCPQGEIFARTLLATWHLSQGELPAAGALIDELIALAPDMPLPRILRIQWLTQSSAPLSARIQACRDVLRVLPGHTDARNMLAALERASSVSFSRSSSLASAGSERSAIGPAMVPLH